MSMSSEPLETATPPHVQFLINGAKQTSSSGETFKAYGSTGEVVSTVESAAWPDIEKAIEAASAAHAEWERTPPAARSHVLLNAAELLIDPKAKYYSAFSDTLSRTFGKNFDLPIQLAACSHIFKDAASLYSRLFGETFPSRHPGGTVLIQRRAYGVVLIATTWNFPVGVAITAIGAALISGNTVVFRSSEIVPRTHELLVELLHDSGLPKGVLNLIHISPENNLDFMPKIIAHEKVKLISFTGNPTVGRLLAAEAGKNLKPIILELGGKGAAVVLDDADIKQAARSIVSGAYFNAGQTCMSTTRVIVQRSVSDILISELQSLIQKLKAGTSEQTNLVAMRDVAAAERVIRYIQGAKDQGAEILVGDMKNDGPIVQPHLLGGYKPDMDAWKNEIFGPVLGVSVCDTVDEAIDLANDTEYSLTSSLWSNNLKALQWASRINSSKLMINGNTFDIEHSMGTHGLGGRSGYGSSYIDDYTQKRTITILHEKTFNVLVDSSGL